MSNRQVPLTDGEYYHIYNRGNSKQNIFWDISDYERFTKLLYLCNSSKDFNFRDDIVKQKIDAWDFKRGEPIVSVGAWVLMPNHFHIYITSSPRRCLGLEEQDAISHYVHKLCTSYSMYVNKKRERTGKLFEGTFKSVHVESDPQAKYNFSYIHLNPVKLIDSDWKENGIKDIKMTLKFLETYPWSSYHDYRDAVRPENKIITPKDFPDYFSDPSIFNEEIFEWLAYNNNHISPALGVA